MKGYEIPTVQQRPPTFKVDKSATIAFNTGEMTPEQKMQILENDGLLGTLFFVPEGMQQPELKKIESTFVAKKPSERLFNVIAVLWRQQGSNGSIDTFYANEMEKKINEYKALLDNNF